MCFLWVTDIQFLGHGFQISGLRILNLWVTDIQFLGHGLKIA